MANPEHLHHLVAEVVDHLHCDAARLRLVERPRGVAVQRRPRVLVDLGLERRLERLVRIVRAEEVRVADEEALLVVVGVDEPAGDAVGIVAADLAGLGSNTSTPFTFTRSLPSFSGSSSMSGSPKMTNRLPLPVFLRSSAMCRSAFMRALSTGMLPSLLNSVVCAS